MNKFIKRAFVGGALASIMAVLPAKANPITWNLSGVTFSDGTSATGSFTLDWDARTLTAFDIATESGVLPAFDYNVGNSVVYFGGFGPNSFSFLENTGNRYVTFSFDAALSSPGAYSINTAYSWDCNNCGTYRTVTAGSVTSADVPEPASIALLGLGFATMGALRRKKAG